MSKFRKGCTYVERGGMWAGIRWRVVDRWKTGKSVYVRLQTAMRSEYARRVAPAMTMRVTSEDGQESCCGGFCGRIMA